MSGVRLAAPLEIKLTIVRLTSVLYSIVVFGNVRNKTSSATTRCCAVRIDDRIASVQFIENRLKRRITEPLISPVAEESNALGLQCIERIFDFTQAGVDIGKRQHGEQSETALVIGNHPRAIFVLSTSEASCLFQASEPNARRRDRNHCCRNTAPVHIFDRPCRRVRLPCLVSLRLLCIRH